MRIQGALKLGLAVALTAVLCGGAQAREAYWKGWYTGRIAAFVYDDEDDKVARVSGKVDGAFDVDTTNSLYISVKFGSLDPVRLTGTYLDESDRKSVVTDEPDDPDDLDVWYPLAYVSPQFKTPKIAPPEIDFDSTTTKGKVSVNKTFQKIKIKNTVSFEGTVGGDGPYAGQTIRGKIKLSVKGDRDDG